MNESFFKNLFQAHANVEECPSPAKVINFFNRLLGFLYPEHCDNEFENIDDLKTYAYNLKKELELILSRRPDCTKGRHSEIATRFWDSLPMIKKAIELDVEAMYAGDPAAKSITEVIRTYPGFYAIATHRMAHSLYNEGLGLIARILSENAHSRTGIDIHPGATIGSHFCIDHGTGIVVGETTTIGNYVKIYQGVTLGALSVRKEDASTKRHPTIEDNVVIYAGASILGGKTIVGKGSIIGGNVWLTKSIPPHSKVYYKAELDISEDNDTSNIMVFK